MKLLLSFMLIFLLISCYNNSDKFEKSYYEKITKIKLPDKYEILETFDNGEYLTITVIQLDSISVKKFISENNLKILKKQSLGLISASVLEKKYRPTLFVNNEFYGLSKSQNKNDWTYLVDLKTNRLWIEISYPDWSGN